MKQLEIEVIDLVADPHHATDEEEKISSSSSRKRLLGTLLRPPLKVFVAKKVFFCHSFALLSKILLNVIIHSEYSVIFLHSMLI